MIRMNESDRNAVCQVHARWIQAELRGDCEAVLDLCTDDVRWLVPDSPVLEGKNAARRFLGSRSVSLDRIDTTDVRIEGTDALAYKTCRYETHFGEHGAAESMIARGTHLWILRRVQGRWKVALVTWQPEDESV